MWNEARLTTSVLNREIESGAVTISPDKAAWEHPDAVVQLEPELKERLTEFALVNNLSESQVVIGAFAFYMATYPTTKQAYVYDQTSKIGDTPATNNDAPVVNPDSV